MIIKTTKKTHKYIKRKIHIHKTITIFAKDVYIPHFSFYQLEDYFMASASTLTRRWSIAFLADGRTSKSACPC